MIIWMFCLEYAVLSLCLNCSQNLLPQAVIFLLTGWCPSWALLQVLLPNRFTCVCVWFSMILTLELLTPAGGVIPCILWVCLLVIATWWRTLAWTPYWGRYDTTRGLVWPGRSFAKLRLSLPKRTHNHGVCSRLVVIMHNLDVGTVDVRTALLMIINN